MLEMMMQKKSSVGGYDNNMLQGISLWDPNSSDCAIKLKDICMFSSSLFFNYFLFQCNLIFCSPL